MCLSLTVGVAIRLRKFFVTLCYYCFLLNRVLIKILHPSDCATVAVSNIPIRLAYTMTINKSQGQAMTICGLDLENSCFSHGQLYIACSRVGKLSIFFVYTPPG